MAKDPICGMTVDEQTALKLNHEGQNYFFCSPHCRDKFLNQRHPKPSAVVEQKFDKIIYTCPMHPEIRQDRPGDCPKCGMPFEPLMPVEHQDEEQGLLKALSLKFWIGLTLAIPVVILALIDMFPIFNVDAFSILIFPRKSGHFEELVLA